ncbi:MAG TPA: hypothetical protein VEV85_24735, partial [Bryobacteraceae bacterium]|nr:hypothetical protein [Bryobacteraceae bacterium]
ATLQQKIDGLTNITRGKNAKFLGHDFGRTLCLDGDRPSRLCERTQADKAIITATRDSQV